MVLLGRNHRLPKTGQVGLSGDTGLKVSGGPGNNLRFFLSTLDFRRVEIKTTEASAGLGSLQRAQGTTILASSTLADLGSLTPASAST